MFFEDLYTSRLNIALNTDSSNGVYSGTNRQRAVNDGYREFSDITECWVVRSAVTVSCNTAEYVLSTLSGFRRLHPSGPEYRLTSSGSSATTMVLAGKDAFPRRDEVWLNTYQPGWNGSTTVGSPTSWYLRNDGGQQLIGLDINPRVGSSEACVLRVPYIAEPDAMTSTGQIPWSDTSGTRADLIGYHQALVHYAASQLLQLTGDVEGAGRQITLFMDYVKRFLGNIRPKGGTHVTLARSYLQQARRRPS